MILFLLRIERYQRLQPGNLSAFCTRKKIDHEAFWDKDRNSEGITWFEIIYLTPYRMYCICRYPYTSLKMNNTSP